MNGFLFPGEIIVTEINSFPGIVVSEIEIREQGDALKFVTR